MYALVLIIHLLIALALCIVVLLQSSKGDGLAGAFGGAGGGQAVFGARGVTTILHKATIYLAIAFMVSSVSLVFLTMGLSREGGGSLSQRAAERVPVSGGAAPSGEAVPVTPGDIPAADAPAQEGGDAAPQSAPAGGGEEQPPDAGDAGGR